MLQSQILRWCAHDLDPIDSLGNIFVYTLEFKETTNSLEWETLDSDILYTNTCIF